MGEEAMIERRRVRRGDAFADAFLCCTAGLFFGALFAAMWLEFARP